MSYIVEYTTLSGKRIPILHKIFESVEDAELHGRKGVAEGNYRAYAVVEAADQEKQYRVTAKSLDDNSTFKGGLKSKEAADKEAEKLRNAKSKRGGKSFDNVKVVTENASKAKLNEAYIKTSKDAIDALGALRKIGKSIETGQGSYDGNLANMYANDVYDVISWAENNLDTNEPNYQKVLGPVIELRKKAKSMEREPGSGKNARFGNEIVNTLYPLMQWIEMNAENKTNEGYKVLPNIDTDRYGERDGLEGPFRTLSGKVVYYDPKEGEYYDPDTDMYMSYDEFRALDNDYSGMKDERDIPVGESFSSEMNKAAKKTHADSAEKRKKMGPVTGDTLKDINDKLGNNKKKVSEGDIVDFSAYAGMYSDGARAAFQGRDGETHTLTATGDRPRRYFINGKETSWEDVKRAVGNQKLHPQQGMTEADDDDRDELTRKLFPKKSREEMEKADRERNRAYNQKRFMKPGKPGRSREWGAYEGVNEAAAKIACLKCDEVSTAKAWQKNNGFCPKCKTSSQGVAESINEADTSYEKDMDNNKAVIVSGVKGTKSTPFRKKFKNMAAYDRWSDSDAAGDYEVQRIMNEGISDDAHHMERDHEVQMARSDLYKTANYAIKLHAILKGISEEQGLEGWMQAKITKAADYLSSVFHALEYDEMERSQGNLAMPTESVTEGYTGRETKDGVWRVFQNGKAASVAGPFKSKQEAAAWIKKQKQDVAETTTAGGIATAPMPMGKAIKRRK